MSIDVMLVVIMVWKVATTEDSPITASVKGEV
jgi:hypothetical protein